MTGINKRRTYTEEPNYSSFLLESSRLNSVNLSAGDESGVEDGHAIKDIQTRHPFEQLVASLKDEVEKDSCMIFKHEKWLLYLLFGLALATRWYKIGWANRTIWDEAYFGKYGLKYLTREYFHDVHPPLGKLLIGLAGKLTGFTGDFAFDSGQEFPKNLRHGLMRMFVSTFGSAIVPFGYLTAKFLGLSKRCRLLTAVLLLFDNGLIVISKFLLLDPFLLCFTSGTICAWSRLHNLRSRPFSRNWITTLFLTGIFMGLNCSVKWGVPLFLVALLGLYTVHDLWMLLGSRKVSRAEYFKHWAYRICGLLIIPGVIYLFSFKMHFAILTKNGPESYSMDSVFISKLEGSGLDKNRIEVADGANVTLRATILNGGLLHSHLHTYPGGSKEQQVTSFRGFDFNNYWTITVPNPATNLDFIKDGTVINLIHHGSGLLLTAQPSVDSPVQKGAYEVSASALSSNAQWKVRIYDDRQAWHVAAVNAITTRVQFENVNGKCMLASADRHLPAWGFNQLEVNCIPNLATTCVDTLWNFEFNYHPKLPVAPKGHIRSRFAWDVYRAHHAMWSTNVGLVPDPDKFNPLASSAADWPLLRRGIRMSSWGNDHIKFFMFGNPFVWWFTSLAVLFFPFQCLASIVRVRRQVYTWSPQALSRFSFIAYAIFGGWCFYYFPFFLMSRVLYLHHYFPALYFACILAPYSLELSLTAYPQKTIDSIFVAVALLSLTGFILFTPLTYGFNYPPSKLAYLKWVNSWSFL